MGRYEVTAPEEHARAARDAIRSGVNAWFEAGRHLADLKASCPDQKTFAAKVEQVVGIGRRHADQLIAIASNSALGNHASQLPADSTSLAKIAQLPATVIEGAIKAGDLHAKATRSEVSEFCREQREDLVPEPTEKKPIPDTSVKERSIKLRIALWQRFDAEFLSLIDRAESSVGVGLAVEQARALIRQLENRVQQYEGVSRG